MVAKWLLAAAVVIPALVAGQAANATAYSGTFSIVDTDTGNRQNLNLSSTPSNFSFDLGLNQSTSVNPIGSFTISPTNASGRMFTDDILATFTFSAPSTQTVSTTGDVSELVVKMRGTVSSSGDVNFDNNFLNVLFTTGDALSIHIGDALLANASGSTRSQTVSATFKETAQAVPAQAVPEPASLSVLGMGLVGLGLVRRVRKARRTKV